MSRVFVIAEAGVNHNGSLELARKLVDTAVDAGADAVKFQTFRASELATAAAKKATYQEANAPGGESQLDMIRKLELDPAGHRALLEYCSARGVTFLSTAFDPESVDLLLDLGVPMLKIPSGEITNPLLLRRVASSGLPLIVSTGMCTLGEIEVALDVIRSTKGHSDEITILHCTTEYPAPLDEVNLRAISTIQSAFGLPVGYSDHTLGVAVPIAAVALGATMIEKHITLDRAMAGPDHAASLEPPELAEMVSGIRTVEKALGTPYKRPTKSELPNIAVARRSLVARGVIRRGEAFSAANLAVKRPGSGIPAIRYDEYIGRVAARDYEPDDLIEP